MNFIKRTAIETKLKLTILTAFTTACLAGASSASAAELYLRAGFALTTNPYTEAITVSGRVRATPSTAPTGGLFISFGGYLTCTLRNPESLTNTPDTLGNVATTVGTASCSTNGAPSFSAKTNLVVRFNSNGTFRNGHIALVAVENGETAEFDFIKAKPITTFTP